MIWAVLSPTMYVYCTSARSSPGFLSQTLVYRPVNELALY